MTKLTYRQFWWQRQLQHLPASNIGAAVFSKFLHYVDPDLMKITKNRLSVPGLVTGLPIVILTSTGAKSGVARTWPAIGIPDGDNIALIASNWGQKHNPAWYYNLRANPIAKLEFNGHIGTYKAKEVTDPDEYQRLWKKGTEVYIGYEKYRQRVGDRKIPMMLLAPYIDNP
jgi:deazaflavin-dependent oxidoreductase (nitroreductase family)